MSLLVRLGQPKRVEPPKLGSEKHTQQQQQKNKQFVRSTKTMVVKKEVVARQQAGVKETSTGGKMDPVSSLKPI